MSDFLKVNADLHLHGLYSGGVSEKMIPFVIGQQAPLKGLQLLGTGDILNQKWIEMVKKDLEPAPGGFMRHENGASFVLQTEVEDNQRVHHIILFPEFSKVEEVREAFKRKCKDLDTDGRPKIWLNAEEITEICSGAGCMVGFSHAFTPYFGLLAKFKSYKQCYGSQWKNIRFLELGLSADTDMADRISELHELTFTSNSDAHSPWPNKMGREFNQFLMKDMSFEELAMALKREGGRKATLNVGFNPLEGKYHKTRCTGCLTFFEPKDAEKFGWRCPDCKKPIKKGVDFRVEELADLPAGQHPEHRPKYIHIVPLSEIIALALKVSSPYSDKVQGLWKSFVGVLGSEIVVLLESPIADIAKIDPKVAEYIKYFREDKIGYMPGGAGVYGKLLQPGKRPEMKVFRFKQKGLGDFLG
jgi:uncharacterized protein (TIGR00375 family)